MTKDELRGATGYKLRMRYNKWWLYLFKDMGGDVWKNVGEFGPFDNMPHDKHTALNNAISDFKALGLIHIEKELGDRGK